MTNNLSVVVNADAQQVWTMLREPAKVAQWHGWEAEDQSAGEPYDLTLATGEEISGRVWFRSNHQVGLTVHSYAEHGDGAVIVADQPAVPELRPRRRLPGHPVHLRTRRPPAGGHPQPLGELAR